MMGVEAHSGDALEAIPDAERQEKEPTPIDVAIDAAIKSRNLREGIGDQTRAAGIAMVDALTADDLEAIWWDDVLLGQPESLRAELKQRLGLTE